MFTLNVRPWEQLAYPNPWILEGSGETEKAQCFFWNRVSLALGVDHIDWSHHYPRNGCHNTIQTQDFLQDRVQPSLL